METERAALLSRAARDAEERATRERNDDDDYDGIAGYGETAVNVDGANAGTSMTRRGFMMESSTLSHVKRYVRGLLGDEDDDEDDEDDDGMRSSYGGIASDEENGRTMRRRSQGEGRGRGRRVLAWGLLALGSVALLGAAKTAVTSLFKQRRLLQLAKRGVQSKK